MEYRGYEINEVWTYTDGKGDFEVYEKGGDTGNIHHRVTLESIIEEIDDELLTEA